MMTAPHRFAISPVGDGQAHLLYLRSVATELGGMAATTWPDQQKPRIFDTAAAAIAFAKVELGATDEDFAPSPGRS